MATRKGICRASLVVLFLFVLLSIFSSPIVQAQQEHVYGAKTARPYTVDDYLYGRTFVYNMFKKRTTPGSPTTPGSEAYKAPIEPFRIAGNTYYVGVTGQGSYLIATDEGHILIEQPYEDSAPLIAESIQKLGFKLTDIKILTATECHGDHLGGGAYFKNLTGAQMVMMEGMAEDAEKGTCGSPAVKVDRVLQHMDQIKLGGTVVTAYRVPGHLSGATTFMWQVTEKGQVYNMAEVCCWSNFPPSQNFVSDPQYPTELLRSNFELLKSLAVDIPTPGAHSDHFDLQGKLAKQKANPGVNPWIAPQDYRGVIAWWEWAFQQELMRQLKEGPPPPRDPNAPRPPRDPSVPRSFPPAPDRP